jgi:ABC-type methionine transport system permease subunit
MPLETWKASSKFLISFNLKSKTQSNSLSEIIIFLYRTKNVIKGCPFILMMKALKPFTAVLEVADKTFVHKFASEVK